VKLVSSLAIVQIVEHPIVPLQILISGSGYSTHLLESGLYFSEGIDSNSGIVK